MSSRTGAVWPISSREGKCEMPNMCYTPASNEITCYSNWPWLKSATHVALQTPNVSFIVPARNESATIANIVATCHQFFRALKIPGEIIVVSDDSQDETAEIARKAGATVIELIGGRSKAAAMRAGALHATSDTLFLLDADLIGLSAEHLERMFYMFTRYQCEMACGTFDYGVFSIIVERAPWSTGQRIVKKSLLLSALHNVQGYSAEVAINSEVGASGGTTIAVTLSGLTQRTKADKMGWRRGVVANIRMWSSIANQMRPVLRSRNYLQYAANIRLGRRRSGLSRDRISPIVLALALICVAHLVPAAQAHRDQQ